MYGKRKTCVFRENLGGFLCTKQIASVRSSMGIMIWFAAHRWRIRPDFVSDICSFGSGLTIWLLDGLSSIWSKCHWLEPSEDIESHWFSSLGYQNHNIMTVRLSNSSEICSQICTAIWFWAWTCVIILTKTRTMCSTKNLMKHYGEYSWTGMKRWAEINGYWMLDRFVVRLVTG